MESEEKKNDLQSFLHAIRTTEVLLQDIEIQISLLNQIGDLYQLETLDVIVLCQWLVVSFNNFIRSIHYLGICYVDLNNYVDILGDSACAGVSNCLLYKTVLHVAIKYFESDTLNCLSQFAILGTKACTWCIKHFQSFVDGSQEEQHRSMFYQLIVDALSFSSVVISALTKCPPSQDENNSLIIQNFMYDALCFTRTLIVEIKFSKGFLSDKISVEDIILTLISLSVTSLRSAAEFYLINTVRISSEYPSNAMNIYKEIVRCVVLISSLRVLLCKESHLTSLSEAMAELLEPTSFLLMHQLINSSEVNSDSKLQLLECLFPHEVGFSKLDPLRDTDITASSASLLDVFDASSDTLQEFESLQLGKVFLFLYFLRTSSSLREEVMVEISRKLDNLLFVLTNAIIFSSVLGLQIPVFGALGPNGGVVWQPMFTIVLNALKVFMIVAASSKLPWMEIEFFLFHNLFHPHFLCVEIVLELLSFLVRHAQIDKVSQIFGNLCLLLMTIASSDPCLLPLSAFKEVGQINMRPAMLCNI
ncbi:hypothetical protein HPP92_025559 [Vanilla planifolia]|uniref:Uncharacterized protein n=1 Tax=Vanilla planifolia TaxID=51239 RepID=A0A835PI85_VANPL|nr:hypothetical protein HPP92_025559 [Vanilla planifolia]